MTKLKKRVLPYLKNVYESLAQTKKMLNPKSYEEGILTLKEIQLSNLWNQESHEAINNGASENDITARYDFYNKFLDIDLIVLVNSNTRDISATRTSILFENKNTSIKR